MNKSWVSLATATLWYSVLLAAIMEAAQAAVRLLLYLVTASASVDLVAVVGDLISKILWSVLGCEAVVLLSILARRKWLLIVLAAGVSIFVGEFMGGFLTAWVETMFGRVTTFIMQVELNASALLGSKYALVGAAVAWADRTEGNALRNYVVAGLVAAIGAASVTWFVMNADFASKIGTIAIDFVFPIGCSTVVWKVRQLTQSLAETHDQTKAQLRKI